MKLAISYVLLFIWLYWTIIGLFGFFPPRRLKRRGAHKRFLILVPAHNEAAVIGELVDSVLSIEYPQDLYDLYVIADNCDDQTAQIVRLAGGNAIEHTYKPGEPKGKPYAIAWAFEQIDLDPYDGVVVFDADNLVSKNFLRLMNNHLCAGHKLVQAYLDTKNPTDNWIAAGYATSYYYMNRSWQLARERLGLGAAIGGTGFCVDAKLLQQIGWSARSLTEDLEFQMQCLLVGVRAHWCHNAKVYDEKPLSLKASVVQRLRWARGHWQVCFRYVGPLLWRAISRLDIRALDGAMYLINPGKMVIQGFTGLLVFTQTVGAWTGRPLFLWPTVVPPNLWYGMFGLQLILMAWAIWADSRPNFWRKLINIVWLWPLNFTYYPLFIWSLLTMRSKEWNPTKHTRAITPKEIAERDH